MKEGREGGRDEGRKKEGREGGRDRTPAGHSYFRHKQLGKVEDNAIYSAYLLFSFYFKLAVSSI